LKRPRCGGLTLTSEDVPSRSVSVVTASVVLSPESTVMPEPPPVMVRGAESWVPRSNGSGASSVELPERAIKGAPAMITFVKDLFCS
jgi:hypothetical protein